MIDHYQCPTIPFFSNTGSSSPHCRWNRHTGPGLTQPCEATSGWLFPMDSYGLRHHHFGCLPWDYPSNSQVIRLGHCQQAVQITRRRASNFSPLLMSRYPGAGRQGSQMLWSIAVSLTTTSGSWPDLNQQQILTNNGIYQQWILIDQHDNWPRRKKRYFWTQWLYSQFLWSILFNTIE